MADDPEVYVRANAALDRMVRRREWPQYPGIRVAEFREDVREWTDEQGHRHVSWRDSAGFYTLDLTLAERLLPPGSVMDVG